MAATVAETQTLPAAALRSMAAALLLTMLASAASSVGVHLVRTLLHRPQSDVKTAVDPARAARIWSAAAAVALVTTIAQMCASSVVPLALGVVVSAGSARLASGLLERFSQRSPALPIESGLLIAAGMTLLVLVTPATGDEQPVVTKTGDFKGVDLLQHVLLSALLVLLVVVSIHEHQRAFLPAPVEGHGDASLRRRAQVLLRKGIMLIPVKVTTDLRRAYAYATLAAAVGAEAALLQKCVAELLLLPHDSVEDGRWLWLGTLAVAWVAASVLQCYWWLRAETTAPSLENADRIRRSYCGLWVVFGIVEGVFVFHDWLDANTFVVSAALLIYFVGFHRFDAMKVPASDRDLGEAELLGLYSAAEELLDVSDDDSGLKCAEGSEWHDRTPQDYHPPAFFRRLG